MGSSLYRSSPAFGGSSILVYPACPELRGEPRRACAPGSLLTLVAQAFLPVLLGFSFFCRVRLLLARHRREAGRSSPRCHPACPEPSRRDRSGPIFLLRRIMARRAAEWRDRGWIDPHPARWDHHATTFFLPLVAQAFLPARAWGEVPPVLVDVRCGEAKTPGAMRVCVLDCR